MRGAVSPALVALARLPAKAGQGVRGWEISVAIKKF
jgi:hypothetical protein